VFKKNKNKTTRLKTSHAVGVQRKTVITLLSTDRNDMHELTVKANPVILPPDQYYSVSFCHAKFAPFIVIKQ
jgi:hypothetical protein